jgi:hypothetical protein
MKTLNLNKLSLLIGLFLISAFFTTSANAACVESSAGVIETDYSSGNGDKPVTDTVADEDTAAGDQKDFCLVTPSEYKLVFYKYGICKADPSLGDLSSCAMLFEMPAGIEHDIEKGVVESLAIPEFAVEPGIYPFSYVSLSNKLGMKWSGTMQASTTGKDPAGNSGDGIYCWTSGHGPRGSASQNEYDPNADTGGESVATVHGATLAFTDNVTIDCGAAAGTALFNYEIIPRFSEGYCEDDLEANGDKQTFPLEGVGSGRGIPSVSLLTAADVFATTCQTAAKIAWTTALSTALTVTEDSSFSMSIKATDANSVEWNAGDNNDIQFVGSGAPRIMLEIEG